MKRKHYCIVTLLLFAILLSACNASVPSSSSLSGSSGSTSGAMSDSLTALDAHNYFQGYPPAPDGQGPFTLITEDDLPDVWGTWRFWPDGEMNVTRARLWSFRLGENGESQIQLGNGLYELGGGALYDGNYTFEEEGVLAANLRPRKMGELPDPPPPAVAVKIRIEIVGDSGLVLYTLMEYTVPDGDTEFEAAFGDWVGRAIPTYWVDMG